MRSFCSNNRSRQKRTAINSATTDEENRVPERIFYAIGNLVDRHATRASAARVIHDQGKAVAIIQETLNSQFTRTAVTAGREKGEIQ
jgi:hypothetical protein